MVDHKDKEDQRVFQVWEDLKEDQVAPVDLDHLDLVDPLVFLETLVHQDRWDLQNSLNRTKGWTVID